MTTLSRSFLIALVSFLLASGCGVEPGVDDADDSFALEAQGSEEQASLQHGSNRGRHRGPDADSDTDSDSDSDVDSDGGVDVPPPSDGSGPPPPGDGAFAAPPNGYQVNVPDLPQGVLDVAAQKLRDTTTIELPSQHARCPLPPRTYHLGGTARVSFTNVAVVWHNMDIKFFFRFSLTTQAGDVSMNGYYDALWILYVVSNGQSCDLDIVHEWSDIYQFSFNADGCAGEFEQHELEDIENNVRQKMNQEIAVEMRDFDLALQKECSQIIGINPVNGNGDITVGLNGTKTVDITVLNTGETSWRSGEYVGLGLIGDGDSPCDDVTHRSRWFVDRTVPPGDTYHFMVQVTGAGQFARYDCDWRTIRDRDAFLIAAHWFGQPNPTDIVVVHPPIIRR